MYKLPGFGAREHWAMYQQLVELLMEAPVESDGSRRVPHGVLDVPHADLAIYTALLANTREALAAHPEHALHRWTVNYNVRGMYVIARPPVDG